MAHTHSEQHAIVELYTLPGCYACVYARRRLRRRGAESIEIPVTDLPGARARLQELTGGWTVPQIVIDGEPVGGAEALAFLDRRGALVPRLRREAFPVAVVRRRSRLARLLGLGGSRRVRYRVELVDREGRILDRSDAESREAAERRANWSESRGAESFTPLISTLGKNAASANQN